ncbi:MAG: hypothetical protein KDC33_12670 [Thermoleophilia bacterium]|nr:hypothetical protein [Thermoleophilia bacterium]
MLGMGMGSWMLLRQARDGHPPGPPWGVLHAHVLLMGFMLMLIIGVAFWMFPRVRGGRPGRGGGWAAFACINAGLLLRLASEAPARDGATGWRVALGVAAVLPLAGAAAFALAILPRVRAAMTPQEARRLRAQRDSRAGGGGS